MGEYSLSLFDEPSNKDWVAYGIVFLVACYIMLMLLSYFVFEYHRYERPENYHLTRVKLRNDVAVTLTMSNTQRKVPIQPVAVAFKDLWYTGSVSGKRALMGSTGAGKTTLMDVIAGRKTAGTIQGEILLNGHPATDLSVRRCTGYCQETDVHSSASTFREALTFSAFLRQSSDVPDNVKFDTVYECLELLGLETVADQMVRGSSMEKMKRLTIGVEMAARPSVLFLDEPTSGLDARAAKITMDGVRNVAAIGVTVVCTIHQPSSDLFFLFDRLLLLKRGGEVVYFGDVGREGSSIIKFFEEIPGVPRIQVGNNPAWMLEVIGAGVDTCQQHEQAKSNVAEVDVDFVGYFNGSTSKSLLDDKLSAPGLFQPLLGQHPLSFDSKRASSNITQLRFLLKRFFTRYWRTPLYNLMRFGISLLLGIIFGFVYLGAEYETYQGINSGLGMIYLSTMFVSIISFMSGLPVAFEERAGFYRERASQTYNSIWFLLSFSVVEIPYVFTGCLVFTIVDYPMVGFVGIAEAVLYWVNLSLMVLFQAYLDQLATFTASSMEVAAIFGVLINAISLMLAGFNPPALQIPQGYKGIYDCVPHRYAFSAFVAIIFGNCSNRQVVEISLAAASPGGLSSLDVSNYPLGCRIVQNAPSSVGAIPIKIYLQEVFDTDSLQCPAQSTPQGRANTAK